MSASDKTLASGVYIIEHVRDGKVIDRQECPNLVVDEGLTHMLGVTFNSVTQISGWYLGIYETNYTPQADDDATNVASRTTESTAYNEGTRVSWQKGAVAANAISNSANRATFTMNATKTIYGCFLVSNSAKQAVSGTLISVAPFTNARSVISGDELVVTYTLTASDV